MKYPRPPFDTAAEIIKMRMYTNLPITDIVFLNPAQEFEQKETEDPWPTEVAELYTADTAIGTVNYMIIIGVIGFNDTMDGLDWNKVYQLCAEDIFPLIQALEPRAQTARPIKYQRLSVYDSNGTELTQVNCVYRDQWNVNLMGLDHVERKVSVSVELKPPPPFDI